ncbi:hypothetical protein SAMN05660226_00739 [Parapedobacter luteus]|uniref:Uncharacterized protein n=2 Tax=Sphingobacteriaceae TaxID=84566 RepID=A0A1T5AHA9_9SPHI|nr:hypothetical protein SAMN05660226_00739 [Parapedobacter luteus]
MQPSLDGKLLITVYRTNVVEEWQAKPILEMLALRFPGSCFSFDLWDSDRVLRMESTTNIDAEVVSLFRDHGFECELL